MRGKSLSIAIRVDESAIEAVLVHSLDVAPLALVGGVVNLPHAIHICCFFLFCTPSSCPARLLILTSTARIVSTVVMERACMRRWQEKDLDDDDDDEDDVLNKTDFFGANLLDNESSG